MPQRALSPIMKFHASLSQIQKIACFELNGSINLAY